MSTRKLAHQLASNMKRKNLVSSWAVASAVAGRLPAPCCATSRPFYGALHHSLMGRPFSSASASNIDALETLKQFSSRLRSMQSLRYPSSPTKASLRQLAHDLYIAYPRLPSLRAGQERRAILSFLANDCVPERSDVTAAIDHFQTALAANDPDVSLSSALLRLQSATTPGYESIFSALGEQNAVEGMALLLWIRQDVLEVTACEKSAALKQLDRHLQTLLAHWLVPGLLRMERIAYDTTPAAVIETIAKHEAVHPMQSLDDLRQRLGPDRRVFGLFHPLTENQPLVVLYVSLQPNIPASMTQVHQSSPEQATVAVFYSISNLQPALAGIGLGEYLIKQAVERLRQEWPALRTFVTLSPIPRFRKWLEASVQATGKFAPDNDLLAVPWREKLAAALGCSVDQALSQFVAHLAVHGPQSVALDESLVEEVLKRLAARYLLEEKHRRKPLDAVERFHVGNGAELYAIQPSADMSAKGWRNSFGVMVNYRYQLDEMASNQAQYETDYTIPLGEPVAQLQCHR